MPSVDDSNIMCNLNNSSISNQDSPATSPPKSDFLSKDMENLVSEIKENLKLSTFKVKSQRNRAARSRPYSIPSQSCEDTMDCDRSFLVDLACASCHSFVETKTLISLREALL